MLNDSFSCRSTFFCILRDKNGYTIINGTGNYYTEAQTREQTRTDIIVDYLGKQHVYQTIHMFFPLVYLPQYVVLTYFNIFFECFIVITEYFDIMFLGAITH